MLLAEDWNSTTQASSSNVHVVRLWVTLPNLPSMLRSRRGLIAIVNAVGFYMPLEFSFETAKCSKTAHPRLRAHVDR